MRLQRVYRALVFDWDGTAVVNRNENASELARLSETLLADGVWLIIVTGTNFEHIDRQFCQLIPPNLRPGIIVCANRGSQVFGFSSAGAVQLQWSRTATPDENQALDAIAAAMQTTLQEQFQLETAIIADRLNRRKLDLIPLPEWANPPKAHIGALLNAVEHRLHAAGIADGLAQVMSLATDEAQRLRLPDARITSDVKHIEVGLTDKGDAMAWIAKVFLPREEIDWEDVLILGDEFGPIAGFPGSDSLLQSQGDVATVISVGAEPNGVPTPVILLGGGPARFREILATQIHLRHQPVRTRPMPDGHAWLETLLAAPEDHTWEIHELGYHSADERVRETRLAIGNGFLGTRGSVEVPTLASNPGTYVAGMFAPSAMPPHLETILSGPQWTSLHIKFNHTPLTMEHADALGYSRTLDMKHGILKSEWYPVERDCRISVVRLASLAQRAVTLVAARIDVPQAEPIVVESSWGEPDRLLHLKQIVNSTHIWCVMERPHCLAVAEEASLWLADTPLAPEHNEQGKPQRWQWIARKDRPATFQRLLTWAQGTERDAVAQQAQHTLQQATDDGIEQIIQAHCNAWEERWQASDIIIEGDEESQRAVRFALYHLISAADPTNEYVSVGARALTGGGYLGHIFWDTEIYQVPFYAYTWPTAARALLMYRYHTLPAAREKAATLGYRGAFYAWESTTSGAETTPESITIPDGTTIHIYNGVRELHISADVAYAVWTYWEVTEDEAFLRDAGAEMLLETARFWSSRAREEADGTYHIRGVIGPDEYHLQVDDDAFTNALARWNIERGLEVAQLLATRWPDRWQALSAQLGLSARELDAWHLCATHLTLGRTRDGVREQFEGYFGLEDDQAITNQPRNISVEISPGIDRLQHIQLIKQADVVMLQVLLRDHFSSEERAANFAYYTPRCRQGSSLSPPMHALAAAQLGDMERAERYWRQSLSIDLQASRGDTAGGIHIATQGGIWQVAVFGFAGVWFHDQTLTLDPHVPAHWHVLRVPLGWRGRQMVVEYRHQPDQCLVHLARGAPMTVCLGTLCHHLSTGETWRSRWDEATHTWQEEDDEQPI